MEKSNSSNFYNPIFSNTPLPPLQRKTESSRDQGSKEAVFTCAGHVISLKQTTFFTLKLEKNLQGDWHFKIAPYQNAQPDGQKCPLVLLFEGHVYYSRDDAYALDDALSSETDLHHPILQIYNERDPSVDNSTCWHELDPDALMPLQEELSTHLGLTSITEKSDAEHKDLTAPSRKSRETRPLHTHTHKKRATHKDESEDQEKVKKDPKSAADQRLIDDNPGSLLNRVEQSNKWVEDEAIEFNESKAQDTKQYLEKADLGHLDHVQPLYKNSLRSQNKEEKTLNKSEHSETPEHERRQIDISRSNFPV